MFHRHATSVRCSWGTGELNRQPFTSNQDRRDALAPWVEALQHSATTNRTRRQTPDQPTVTNLMAEHS